MMYKVTKFFTDMQDNNHPYDVGDVFPRDGVSVLPSRIKELASSDNRRGIPLIEFVEEESEDQKETKKQRKQKSEEEPEE